MAIRYLLAAAVIFSTAAQLFAQDDKTKSVEQQQRETILQALEKTATFEFIEKPLHDVVKAISAEVKQPIVIDTRSLDGVGIKTNVPVTRILHKMRVRKAINFILADLELAWIIRDGSLTITTREVADATFVTTVLDIGDLVHRDRADSSLPPQWRSSIDKLTLHVRRKTYGGKMEQTDFLDLVHRATGDPRDWTIDRGSGSIQIHGNTADILQTQPVIDEIERLVAALRTLQKAEADGTPEAFIDCPPPTAVEKKIHQAMQDKTMLAFDRTSLGDVLKEISDRHAIPVVLDTRALAGVGIGSDTPITAKIHGVMLKQALRRMLRDLELTYVVHNDALIITTLEEAEAFLTTRLYRVADLEADYDTLIDLIVFSLKPDPWDDGHYGQAIVPIRPWRAIAVRSTGNVHAQIEDLLRKLRSKYKPAPKEKDPSSPVLSSVVNKLALDKQDSPRVPPDRLIAAIKKVIAPESWGKEATIGELRGRLVVRQSADVHDRIRRMLIAIDALHTPPAQTNAPQ